MPIAFVKSGTIVQEITADGRCVEHLQAAERTEEDEKQERINNLPEFRQNRGMTSLAEQLEAQTAGVDAEEENEKAQEVAEMDAEDDEFRRQLDQEAKALREEQRELHKRDRDEFEQARRELEITPSVKVRAVENRMRTKARPEIVFRKKGTSDVLPNRTAQSSACATPSEATAPSEANATPRAPQGSPSEAGAPSEAKGVLSSITAALDYDSDSD